MLNIQRLSLFLKQCILIVFSIFSCFLILSLITYYPFDDSYFQFTGNLYFHNMFGEIGAVSSDVLFFMFGCVAYIVPCNIFFIVWICLFSKKLFNFLNLLFKTIGSMISLFSLCCLIEFLVDDFYYCFSGGIIGYLLLIKICYIFDNNNFVMNIILFSVLVLGVTLLSGFPWMAAFQKIINIILKYFIFNNRYINKIYRMVFLRNIFSNMKLYIHDILNKIEYIRSIMVCFLHKKKINNTRLTINNNSVFIFDKIFELKCNSVLFIKQLKKLKKSFKNRSPVSVFKLPDIHLLSSLPILEKSLDMVSIEKQSKLLELKLKEYCIHGHVVNILKGPVITRFELELAPGLKSSQISSISRDLARSLSLPYLRVIEVIPGNPYIGLEIPNNKRDIIYLREILDTEKFRSSSSFLTLALGKDIIGNPTVVDLSNMPHLLVAGTTGSGKSIGINNMIISILYKSTPEDVCFIMIDLKILELSIYTGIPHLLQDVITDTKDVVGVLNWCVTEMERRYKIMASCRVRNIKQYNDYIGSEIMDEYFVGASCTNSELKDISDTILKKFPYIVVVIDEYSDLIMSVGKEVELLIIRLTQKARACGIHLILATQRPSVNVITGLIKANIPSRIAFSVSSKVDSRTILDQSGAESLLGLGDMLYLSSNSSIPIRIHGAFISDEEVCSVVEYWRKVSI